MNFRALIAASLTFGLAFYLSTIAGSYSVDFPTPFGNIPLAYPLAGFVDIILIVGGLGAVIVYFIMAKDGVNR